MRYRLATYRECKAHREWNTTCPDCGRKGEFSPYIDTVTMEPVDDSQCGRCNRLSNCGYHLPPREMLASPNPLPKRGLAESAMSAAPSLRGRAGGEAAFYEKMHRAMQQSKPWGHHLATWLRTKFPRERVDAVMKRYHVGGTPDGATLWWQIDEQGRVHTGKAMQYNPLTGHRVKEGTPSLETRKLYSLGEINLPSSQPTLISRWPPLWGEGSAMAAKPLHRGRGWGGSSPVNWAHRMRLYGEPTDLIVPQCLFGLHLAPLLSPQGGKTAMPEYSPLGEIEGAAIVESEKTALILSLLCPDKVWLATGGKQNFKEQMLWPLLGYEVEVYPDADALADWYARAVEINRTLGIRLHIPTWYYDLMNHDEARRAGLDLADVLLR